MDTLTRTVLNVGGGSKDIPIPERYEEFAHVLLDIAPGKDVDLVYDALQLDRYDEQKFSAVYSSHTIEHFHPWEVPTLLHGMRHVLESDGTLEIHCPDIEPALKAIVDGYDVDSVLYVSPAGPITVHDMIYSQGIKVKLGGIPMMHKTCFTMPRLRKFVERAGFRVVHMESEGYELACFAER